MSTSTVIVLAVLLAALLAYLLFVARGREIYVERACQGAQWRTQFPDASKDDIRSFLRFFSSAFAISRKHFLLVSPQDELLAIYRARYPSRADPDALEFETLAKDLSKRYGISLERVWHDHFTVGEQFSLVVSAQQGAPVDAKTASKFRRGRA